MPICSTICWSCLECSVIRPCTSDSSRTSWPLCAPNNAQCGHTRTLQPERQTSSWGLSCSLQKPTVFSSASFFFFLSSSRVLAKVSLKLVVFRCFASFSISSPEAGLAKNVLCSALWRGEFVGDPRKVASEGLSSAWSNCEHWKRQILKHGYEIQLTAWLWRLRTLSMAKFLGNFCGLSNWLSTLYQVRFMACKRCLPVLWTCEGQLRGLVAFPC